MRIKKAFVNDQTWGCRPDFSCSPGGELDRRALAKVSLRGGLIEFQQGTALEEIIRLLPPSVMLVKGNTKSFGVTRMPPPLEWRSLVHRISKKLSGTSWRSLEVL